MEFLDGLAILSLISSAIPNCNVTVGDTVLFYDTASRHLCPMGPAWAGFLKMFNTRTLCCCCFPFLVLNAENQKGGTINLLEQREKRNHTL